MAGLRSRCWRTARDAGTLIHPVDRRRGTGKARRDFAKTFRIMSEPPPIPASPSMTAGPSGEKALRKLFLTLFLRGHSARGLKKQGAPQSVFSKLALVLFFYALFGMVALTFIHQPVFALSLYLHAVDDGFSRNVGQSRGIVRAKSCSTKKKQTFFCIALYSQSASLGQDWSFGESIVMDGLRF